MKAAVLFEVPGRLQIEDIEVDHPRRGEVLVKVAASGLCHSDLHAMRGQIDENVPSVLGHEASGTVAEVGPGVEGLRAGDHVLGFLAAYCGVCDYCLSGRPTLCRQNFDRGPVEPPRLRLADGTPLHQFAGLAAFAEQMLVHEHHLVKIDPSIPLDRAALVGCAVPTGVGAVIRTARVPAGATVAVIGCGGVGLNVIQGATLAGARRIVAIDIDPGKLERAHDFGATDLVDNSNGDALEQVEALLPGELGVDFSFEVLGRVDTYQLAAALLRPGGTATLIGLPEQRPIPLPPGTFNGERKIQGCSMGSVRFPTDLPYLLGLYRAGRLKLDELVSRQIRLEEINESYDAIGRGDIARSVIVFD